MKNYRPLSPSSRTIMTPGPVEAEPRVLRAMSYPVLGQFDPEFTQLMNESMEMLREVFCTANEWAFPVDGTSRSGLEAVLVSLIVPGDVVLVPIFGRFGLLLVEIAERCGAEVITLQQEWGSVFDPEVIIQSIHRHKPSLVAVVHGETSTGQMQPLGEVGTACRELDILLVTDAVATLGGTPVETDEWKLDAVIGGTQKCLSIPSGLAPITYNDRVERRLKQRRSVEKGLQNSEAESSHLRINSNYLDLSQLQDYWGPSRLNHHTEATSMQYGLHEGLQVILEEGLQARFARHKLNEEALVAGLQAMGLQLYGDKTSKLPVVTCVQIPSSVNGEFTRQMLLNHFGVEIAGSFGPLQGKIWRIGTMGYSCRKTNILQVLMALEAVLIHQGMKLPAGEGVQAALHRYTREDSIIQQAMR
ncbi:alanine--glyoxylate aminotransferase family protein [Paenibacillus sp. JX-17]|uniref:Alanine--glyoxylate aminotransferase family protein n=1 Tax=Paenibacillus lacisoli TaxID=3064525 RepID=A0ABT9C8K2_9BACL|nr:alanine--glyoxylate aminotransferase family protein [Paenibacillus sp. JX-17]MDO7905583.1 alanine--glyoxylate aminotransferase family protein [Paenibacillus sp. JX-17]